MVFTAILSFVLHHVSASNVVLLMLVVLIMALSSRIIFRDLELLLDKDSNNVNTEQKTPQQEDTTHVSQQQQQEVTVPQELIDVWNLCDKDESELDSLSFSSTDSATSSGSYSLSPSSSLSQLDSEMLEKQNKEVEEDVEWTLNALEQRVERKSVFYEADIDTKIDELYSSLKLKTAKKKKGLFNWLAKDSYDRSPQLLFTSAQQSIKTFFKGKVMVKNILNEELARQFVRQWALYKLRYGPGSTEAQPKMAFHGTKEASQNIIQDGIKLPGSPGFQSTCNVFGPGIYLSTNPGISDHYTEGKKLVVCAVLPGKSGVYSDRCKYDSYRNQAGDVLVMPSASQVLPIYLVRYHNVKAKAPPVHCK
eukprot:TRINITY_DN11648_c0_g1_i1.p1 TRINITY_DN11648_c0_g1~~TRINITY_DN11648_c0_g1_i1.p1  ORF type:complete len:364 (+),score=99.59 TRINITY_DN11648_c0_g1_i1:176-1267(+)